MEQEQNQSIRDVDVFDLCDYVKLKYAINGQALTNLVINKVLYFIQGWHLAYFKSKLFNDVPQAWVYGPVYSRVYRKFKNVSNIASLDADDLSKLLDDAKLKLNLEEKQQKFLDSVISHYGKKSAFELTSISHDTDPWINARKDLSIVENSMNYIPHQNMLDYFSSRLKSQR